MAFRLRAVPSPSLPALVALAAFLQSRAVHVLDEELLELGVAVFPPLALLNHSCRPTTALFFRAGAASLRSLQALPAQAELTLSYCDVLAPLAVRQAALLPWGFTCACARCAEEASQGGVDLRPLDAAWRDQLALRDWAGARTTLRTLLAALGAPWPPLLPQRVLAALALARLEAAQGTRLDALHATRLALDLHRALHSVHVAELERLLLELEHGPA